MTSTSEKISIALIDLNAGVANLGVSAIESRLREAGMSWSRYEPRIAGTMPAKDHDAAILTGGPGSPVEDLPWRTKVLSWLTHLPETTPVLGICMGCQLLAAAHGWSLQELKEPRFGVYPLGLTSHGTQDRILGSLGTQSTVFEQRRWGIFPQPGAHRGTPLARSESGEATAFRFHDHALGTIFHPEAAPVPVQRWISESPAAQHKILQRHGRGGIERQIDRCAGLDSTYTHIIPTFLHHIQRERKH